MEPEHRREAYPPSADEIDVQNLLRTLWRRRLVILAVAASSAALAAAVSTLLLQPLYESRTQILLSEHSAPAYATAESAARILTGPAFLEPLARAAGVERAGSELQRLVAASPVGETRIVDLRIRDRDPARLRAFTETVVAAFVRRASPRVAERRRTIEQRLAKVSAQLEEIERTIGVTRATLERLQEGRPADPAAWFARSFVVSSLATSEQVYAGLLNAQRELRNDLLALEFPTLVQAPYVAARPVAPRPVPNTVVALLGGLLAGTALAFILDAFPAAPPTARAAPAVGQATFAVGPPRAPVRRDAQP